MRQSRTFAAVPGALQRNRCRPLVKQIKQLHYQIGACQAQIIQGQHLPANRQWVECLQGQVNSLQRQIDEYSV